MLLLDPGDIYIMLFLMTDAGTMRLCLTPVRNSVGISVYWHDRRMGGDIQNVISSPPGALCACGPVLVVINV